MKKLFSFFLVLCFAVPAFICSEIYDQSLFFREPLSCTQKEIEEYPKFWEANFITSQGILTGIYDHGNVCIKLSCNESIFLELFDDECALFKKFEDQYIFSKGEATSRDDIRNNETCEYHVANARFFQEGQKPQLIDIDAFIRLIDTKQLLFYTGAGISVASGVNDMNGLLHALGIQQFYNKKNQFLSIIQYILNNTDHIQNEFKVFCQHAYAAPATKAHKAVAMLAKAKKTQIFTENFDLLHERSGIKPIHIDAAWLRENITPDMLQKIDIIVCIGLSHDDRGFLGWYKQYNPQGLILAINLQQPKYLGNEDLLLQGDVEEILPHVITLLKI